MCEDFKNVRVFARGFWGARARQAVARQDNSRKPVWQEPRRGRVVGDEVRAETWSWGVEGGAQIAWVPSGLCMDFGFYCDGDDRAMAGF